MLEFSYGICQYGHCHCVTCEQCFAACFARRNP